MGDAAFSYSPVTPPDLMTIVGGTTSRKKNITVPLTFVIQKRMYIQGLATTVTNYYYSPHIKAAETKKNKHFSDDAAVREMLLVDLCYGTFFFFITTTTKKQHHHKQQQATPLTTRLVPYYYSTQTQRERLFFSPHPGSDCCCC